MYEKTRGIVLHVIKYSDRNSIAHLYTDTHGRMSFLLPQGNTRQARIRNAMFMPLSLIEFEARITTGRDLASFKDCRYTAPFTRLYSDPAKSAVAMFISELLTRSIQESERNLPLFNFIATSAQLLDSLDRGVANFHICFLYHLGAFVGIQPDTATLSRMTFANLHLFRFNRDQRNEILDIALSYYRLHNSTIGDMKSPDILRQVFD